LIAIKHPMQCVSLCFTSDGDDARSTPGDTGIGKCEAFVWIVSEWIDIRNDEAISRGRER
jgi:hypothetical protein